MLRASYSILRKPVSQDKLGAEGALEFEHINAVAKTTCHFRDSIQTEFYFVGFHLRCEVQCAFEQSVVTVYR